MFRNLFTSVVAKSIYYGIFFTVVYNGTTALTNYRPFSWTVVAIDLPLFALIGYTLRYRPAQKRKEAAQRLEATQQLEKTAA